MPIQPVLLTKKTAIVGALRTGGISGTTITATGAEINKLAGNAVTAADLTKLNAITATAAEVNKTDGLTGCLVEMQAARFTEAGEGTYTATLTIPGPQVILDVGVYASVLWDAATSASLVVGDEDDPDGFFTATNLKATDLLAGETNNIEHPGGKAGAYIVSEQRVLYSGAQRKVIGIATSVGAGTAGRTVLWVTYAVPTIVAATKS